MKVKDLINKLNSLSDTLKDVDIVIESDGKYKSPTINNIMKLNHKLLYDGDNKVEKIIIK